MGLDAVDKDKTWEPKQTQKYLGVVFRTTVEHPKGSGTLVVELSLDADYKAGDQMSSVVGKIDKNVQTQLDWMRKNQYEHARTHA